MNREVLIACHEASSKAKEMIEEGFDPERVHEMINTVSQNDDPIVVAYAMKSALETMHVLEKAGSRILLGRERVEADMMLSGMLNFDLDRF